MNTLQNLLDNGIDLITAQSMIENYSSKIGTRNGVYVITDITYDFEQRGKDVTLRCTKCGKEIHRILRSCQFKNDNGFVYPCYR